MRNSRELAIQALSVAVASVLSWQARAQAPTSDTVADENPAVANCNMTPDTQLDPHDPSKRLATPIDAFDPRATVSAGRQHEGANHRRVGQYATRLRFLFLAHLHRAQFARGR
jgi:hypothetical protein